MNKYTCQLPVALQEDSDWKLSVCEIFPERVSVLKTCLTVFLLVL